MNRQALLIFLIVALICGCSGLKNSHKTQQQYLPKLHRDLYLGMSKAEFLAARPNAKLIQEESFREVYMDETADGSISQTGYYVSNTGIMYEILVFYTSEIERDADAKKLLGSPNHKTIEWMFPSKEGFQINIWTYKEKLIYAGLIEGTEWGEE